MLIEGTQRNEQETEVEKMRKYYQQSKLINLTMQKAAIRKGNKQKQTTSK